MLIVERQQRILDALRTRKTVQLDELAKELDVSSSTVRRDLDMLEQKGIVERTHGGAVYKGEPNGGGESSVALTQRLNERVAQKQAIGAAVAAMIQPHMTLLMDGGSTVVFAARQITARPLQIVTNSLAIANLFTDDDQIELLLVGGNLYPRTGVTVGPIATGCLADLHADLLLFSLAGIYGREAYNINLAMSQVEQVMMQQAAESVMLMDSSKFDRKSLVRVCTLDEVDLIVTDDGVEVEWSQTLGEQLRIVPTR